MENTQQIVLKTLQNIRSNREKLTFKDIRDSFIYDHNGKLHNFLKEGSREKINRGRKPLENFEECILYWYYYCATFVPKPWKILANKYEGLHMYKQPVEIYDYASGQGQATILLLDHFYKTKEKNNIKSINLIEKSSFALSIAKDLLKFHSPEIATSKVNLINKNINEFDLGECIEDKNSYKIHLFSYILDMGVINVQNLVKKILSIPGKHFLWAVSQNSGHITNRNSVTGKLYFEEFYDELIKQIISNVEFKHNRYQINLHENQFSNSDGIQKPCLLFGHFFEVK